MIVDAAPLIIGQRCAGNVPGSAVSFLVAYRAVSGFIHKAGFAAHNRPVRIMIFNSPQEPVGNLNSVRIRLRSLRCPGMLGQNLPAQLIVNRGPHDHTHVINRAVMILIVQAYAVGEMRGVRNAKLLRLLIHQLRKGLL